jgi:hypothetical protein
MKQLRNQLMTVRFPQKPAGMLLSVILLLINVIVIIVPNGG